jgi:hypothetical protein
MFTYAAGGQDRLWLPAVPLRAYILLAHFQTQATSSNPRATSDLAPSSHSASPTCGSNSRCRATPAPSRDLAFPLYDALPVLAAKLQHRHLTLGRRPSCGPLATCGSWVRLKNQPGCRLAPTLSYSGSRGGSSPWLLACDRDHILQRQHCTVHFEPSEANGTRSPHHRSSVFSPRPPHCSTSRRVRDEAHGERPAHGQGSNMRAIPLRGQRPRQQWSGICVSRTIYRLESNAP